MNDLLHSNGFDPNFHLAGFDLGKIEQAINEIEETLSVTKEVLEILSLQLRDLPFGLAPK